MWNPKDGLLKENQTSGTKMSPVAELFFFLIQHERIQVSLIELRVLIFKRDLIVLDTATHRNGSWHLPSISSYPAHYMHR